ncbi:MAG: peptidylprolyl isomerase [Opitutaceae bacterium]
MQTAFRNVLSMLVLLAIVACRPAAEDTLEAEEGELARVGSIRILQSDLDYHLQEKYGSRADPSSKKQALDVLIKRAQIQKAALDAGLDKDPLVRAEVSRILSNRLRETQLYPKVEAAYTSITDDHLRELYEAQSDRFQSKEKRQVAVLWLNPGADPERQSAYQSKLKQARDWFLNESDLASQPELGFSVLSVDHSEHAPTRFKGGVLGWLDADGGNSDWSRAVAETAFSLSEVGEVSPVITRSEGIFLVRWMALQPGVRSPFDSVKSKIKSEEQQRLRNALEAEFLNETEQVDVRYNP